MAISREIVGIWVTYFNLFILGYVLFVQVVYIGSLIVAVLHNRRQSKLLRARDFVTLEQAEHIPPITIIVPAYNESLTIAESVRGFLHMEYPQYEVIVVNDGSKDDTLEVLKAEFRLVPVGQVYARRLDTKPVRQVYHSLSHPDLVVIDKENGGKADAINTGINVCRYPLFCVVDADTIIDERALMDVVYPFVENPQEVVAVGGTVRIVNGSTIERGRVTRVQLPSNGWARMQVLEYLRAFLVGRTAWSAMNGLLIIAGAFGVFKTSAVREVGGYAVGTVGEDMELTVRLQRYRYEHGKKWSILYEPDAFCWTQAPEDRVTLYKQRNRWHRGLAESLWRHKRMFGNPKYGIVGMLSMPYFVFIEWLGPLIELLGLITVPLSYAFGYLDLWIAAAFFTASLAYSQIVSVGALLIEERRYRTYTSVKELAVLMLYSAAETFFYRPLNTWWKSKAAFQVRRQKHAWGEMKRTSFGDSQGGKPGMGA